jgi:hypothetical protein
LPIPDVLREHGKRERVFFVSAFLDGKRLEIREPEEIPGKFREGRIGEFDVAYLFRWHSDQFAFRGEPVVGPVQGAFVEFFPDANFIESFEFSDEPNPSVPDRQRSPESRLNGKAV